MRVPSRSTESSCEPAWATVSTCAVMASLKLSQADRPTTAPARRRTDRFIICGEEGARCERRYGRCRDARAARGAATRSGEQAAQRAHEAVQHLRAAQSRELERQRLRPAHIGLELHLVESRGHPLHPGDRISPKANTRFLTAHKDPLH